MSDQTKTKRVGRVNLEFLEKLYKLRNRGFKPIEAAEIMGTSRESIGTYYRIFADMECDLPTMSSKKSFCEAAVRDFAEAHGYPYRHVNDTPAAQEEEPLPGQINVDDIFCEMNREAVSAQSAEPDELRRLRDSMSTAIVRFICAVVDEYLKA